MNFGLNFVLIASIMMVFGIMMGPGNISAETSQNSVTVTPINESNSCKDIWNILKISSKRHGNYRIFKI